MLKYLSPTNDIAFKKIFGDIKNKDILIHFLNDVLNKTGEDAIKDVVIQNPALLPEIEYSKESLLDVLCTDHRGIQYIVEMQVSGKRGFEKRAQYYAAKVYSSQAQKGQDYRQLKEVIFLAILDFVMFPDKDAYKSDHVIMDKVTHEHDLKDFSFTFIELPKFNKIDPEDLKTYEEKWCYFFNYASEPQYMHRFLATIAEEENVIRKAYNVLEAHYWTYEELQRYERMQKINMDMRAREAYVKEEAEAIGEARGIRKVAQKLKQSGMPNEQISEATGLSLDEIHLL